MKGIKILTRHADAGGRLRQAMRQRGFALVAVLMIIVLMTALATAFMMSTSLESQLAFTEHDRIVAAYVAEAGLGWAVNRIRYANWLEDIDINHNNWIEPTKCDGTYWQVKDNLGHFLHGGTETHIDQPQEVWEYRYNDIDNSDTPVCHEFNELPPDTAFRTWAYQDANQKGSNEWTLVSLGYCNNLSAGCKLTFRTINPLLKSAIAADRMIGLHCFDGNTATVNGSIWCNGELEISRNVIINCDTNGPDDYVGRHPATGLLDDQYVAVIGHATVGGIINGDVYTSSADTNQPDAIGLDNKFFYPTIDGILNGVLYLRNGWERNPNIYNFNYDDGYWNNTFRYKLVFGVSDPRVNPLCRMNTPGNEEYYYMDALDIFECETPVALPTLTPTPVAPTFTPTPDGSATPTPTWTPRPFDTPNPNDDFRRWYDINGYYHYSARAETDCGLSEAPPIPLGGTPAPYPTHYPCNGVFVDTSNVAATPNPLDPRYFYDEPPDGKFLVKREFGLHHSNVNFDYFLQAALNAPESKRGSGTYFASWTEFSNYINATSAGEYDLVFPGFKGGTPDSDWVTIGSTEGTIFFIDFDPTERIACFAVPKNLYVRGGIVTESWLDIRDYGEHIRQSDHNYRASLSYAVAFPTPGAVPIPPDYRVMDGVNQLYIDVIDYRYPALMSKGRLWIVQRRYSTTINGLVMAPYFDQYTSTSNAPMIYIDNQTPAGRVSITGAVIGIIVELNHYFQVDYDDRVTEFPAWRDYGSKELTILGFQRDYRFEEAAP
ncbi:hypothetical protein JW905_06690 [bacterium]|nr:hypothetical protein [candidate division CSSED10-310 bacterium]